MKICKQCAPLEFLSSSASGALQSTTSFLGDLRILDIDIEYIICAECQRPESKQ